MALQKESQKAPRYHSVFIPYVTHLMCFKGTNH